MQVVKREVCVGFGLWTEAKPHKGFNDAWNAQRVIEQAKAQAKAQGGAPVSIRTTWIDRSGVKRVTCATY